MYSYAYNTIYFLTADRVRRFYSTKRYGAHKCHLTPEIARIFLGFILVHFGILLCFIQRRKQKLHYIAFKSIDMLLDTGHTIKLNEFNVNSKYIG